MKPTEIKTILDLAWDAHKNGQKFTPMFTGEAGLGKSEIAQQWVKDMQTSEDPEFGFVDVRLAYLEGPDFVGLPTEQVVDKLMRTIYSIPEMWPTKGKGLIFFDEVNRGHSSVMNCLMQVLTDRKIHKYTLPDGWIMAAAVNPNNTSYDVNEIDSALKNRFANFEIEYDHKTFTEFITKAEWHPMLQAWIKSSWAYKRPDEVGTDGHYVSPRSLSILNSALMSGADNPNKRDLHFQVSVSTLGKFLGREFHKYCFEEKPVLCNDLIGNKKETKKALELLKKHSSPDFYRGDLIEATVVSLVENYPDVANKEMLSEVAVIIPADQAVNMLRQCALKANDQNFLSDMTAKFPQLKDALVSSLRDAAKAEEKSK